METVTAVLVATFASFVLVLAYERENRKLHGQVLKLHEQILKLQTAVNRRDEIIRKLCKEAGITYTYEDHLDDMAEVFRAERADKKGEDES